MRALCLNNTNRSGRRCEEEQGDSCQQCRAKDLDERGNTQVARDICRRAFCGVGAELVLYKDQDVLRCHERSGHSQVPSRWEAERRNSTGKIHVDNEQTIQGTTDRVKFGDDADRAGGRGWPERNLY